MSNRALLQNTKLSQKVADFVRCKIRGDQYVTANLSCLVQVISTNPFQIADMYNYIQINDPSPFLEKIREQNPSFNVEDLRGCYFDLQKWNFIANMDWDSNRLNFEIIVESVNNLGGMGTLEYPENPVPLLETLQAKNQLNRLKKFFIAEKFNQEHPFDPTPIEEARNAQSEQIRKSNIAHQHYEVSQNQDPFLIGEHNYAGKESVTHSQMDDYEELSINSQTQRRVGDFFRNRDQLKKPYSTMPADVFGLNLENLSSQPLISGDAIKEAPEKEERDDSLPTFGHVTQDQNKEPDVPTDKIIESEHPRKRNFDDLAAESGENVTFHVQQSKAVKIGWGPNHSSNQSDFRDYRQGKKVDTRSNDPLDLLQMTESQEAELYAAHHYKPQEKRPEYTRPPETRLSKQVHQDDIEIEEEINREKPKQKPQTPPKFESGHAKQKAETGHSKDSSKSWSFGKDQQAEEIAASKHPQYRQASISDFTQKTQHLAKPAPIQQKQVPQTYYLQQPQKSHQPIVQQYEQYSRQSIPVQPIKKFYPKENFAQIQAKKPQNDYIDLEDVRYLESFREIKKPSPTDKLYMLQAKPKLEIRPPARRESGLTNDYLKSFMDLGAPRRSPAAKKFLDLPGKSNGYPDVSDFRQLSGKKTANSSSTLLQRSPKVPSVQASPSKFNENELLYIKRIYDQEVGK